MKITVVFFTVVFNLLFQNFVFSQNIIKGKVIDHKNLPLVGANVFIEGTLDGSTTDSDGKFTFSTLLTGDTILVVKHLSKEDIWQPVFIEKNMPPFLLKMKDPILSLDEIVVTAGSFGIGDKNKSAVLNTMDVETTAGTDGDITGALRTLPGTQVVGESGQLFVRGGSGDESKVMIDGLNIPNPYTSGVPDIAQKSRFSPHLFKGIIFNTGGYSSQYGGALSSVLNLETKDHPSKSSSVIALVPYAIQGGHTFLNKNKDFSGGIDISYSNFSTYYSIVSQYTDWIKSPEGATVTANLRKSTKNNEMFKWYGYGSIQKQSLLSPDYDLPDHFIPYSIKNANAISLLTYKKKLNNLWDINAGYGFNFNRDKINNNQTLIENSTYQHQLRFSVSGKISDRFKPSFGAEGFYFSVHLDTTNIGQKIHHSNYSSGIWAETDIVIMRNFISRPGIRAEYDETLHKFIFLPRLSFAYRTSKFSQINISAGEYSQTPEFLYSYYGKELTFTRAFHYIANYQYTNQKRILRMEGYYKDYRKLITTAPEIGNHGFGYAGGLDLFWRDGKSIKGLDYWISYTWLNTERKYLNYPNKAMPTFASSHTGHLVVKYFIEKLGLFVGTSYSIASGRPYYNPSSPIFLNDRTPFYHNANFNIALLRKWGKTFNTFVFAVNNILGNEQVFGYRYSNDGTNRQSVTLPYKRSFLLGWFISIGQNRSDEILNQLP
ncbi:TonB-dependent receptor [Apibacter sp. HY039]|uniref:TonB-dependent receptor n=1 Tax=Apibacter sp. HY039 TaxID=2501476 RepID=UPI000FEC0385|nr:TonB-dependent receptor [Apibacter sp. HY039]